MSILVWALMEISPKTRIRIQVVYLGGETKKCPGRSSEWDGAGKGALQADCHCGPLEYILTMGRWETQENMKLRGLPSEREGAGVFTCLLSVEGFSKGVCLPQFSSLQSLSHVWLFATPQSAALQASLPITNAWSLLKLMSIESVMPFNHLILCRPLLLLPSIFPSIRVFSNESVLHIRWPKYWNFSFSTVLPMNIAD